MKRQLIFGVIVIVLSTVIAILPHHIFEVCDLPMKCHWTGRVVTMLAVFTGIGGFLMAIVSNKAVRLGVSVMTALAGLMMVAVPTVVIGVCGSKTMVCYTATKPAVILLGLILASICAMFAILQVKDGR